MSAKKLSTLQVEQAASLWYPIMLAEQADAMSESKAAEMLGMNRQRYRELKGEAIATVQRLMSELPSPVRSVMELIAEKPELFG